MLANMEKWLKIFKKYGLEIENIRFLEEGDSFRPCAIDKEKEVLLRVGAPVMLPVDAVKVSDDEHYVSEAYGMPTELREAYNEYLGFVLSDVRIARQQEIYESFSVLPGRCRNILTAFGLAGFFARRTRKQIKIGLLSSRTIVSAGKTYLMPIMDLLNHDIREGIAFKIGERTVKIEGKASESGEVFAIYSGVTDAFSILRNFAFATENRLAFSMAMELSLGKTLQLSIGRDLHRYEIVGERIVLPKYRVENNRLTLSHLWLGSDMDKENAYKSFKILWEERLGLTEAFKVYSSIEKFNNSALDSLRRECDAMEAGIAADMVKKCALEQQRIIVGSTVGCNSLHR